MRFCVCVSPESSLPGTSPKYGPALLEHYKANPGFLAPSHRANEILRFVELSRGRVVDLADGSVIELGGKIVKKYKLDDYVKNNKKQLQDNAKNLGTPALGVVKSFECPVIPLPRH